MQKNKPKTKIPEGCVSSREELAVELEISARWLDTLRKQPGAPEMVQGKYYDVEAWKEFREQEKARRDEEKGLSEKDKKELAKAHLRRDKAIAEKEELKLEQLKGSLIETTAVKMEFQSAWTFELSCLKSALASYPKLTPADASQIFDDFVKLCREYKTELINHAESQSEI